jgi:hypothetical protein
MSADSTAWSAGTRADRRILPGLLLTGATGVLVSGYIHFYVYFEGGYRGIHPENVLGLTISRSFALNAVAAVLIAEAAMLAVRWSAWVRSAAIAGVAFASGTLGAYLMSRSTGLLGFTESTGSVEAAIAIAAEGAALVAFSGVLVIMRHARAAPR